MAALEAQFAQCELQMHPDKTKVVYQVLSAIYEQDFMPYAFGGRPERNAHEALATLNEVVAGRKVSWVLEADLKNFFGSLNHDWLLRFVEHRVGDPRMISLIRRWFKAGVLEDGKVRVLLTRSG